MEDMIAFPIRSCARAHSFCCILRVNSSINLFSILAEACIVGRVDLKVGLSVIRDCEVYRQVRFHFACIDGRIGSQFLLGISS